MVLSHLLCLPLYLKLHYNFGMQKISYNRHRFPPEVIHHAIWLYARFTLSYRDVEDLLVERGLEISYETVRLWFLKFGKEIARNLKPTCPTSVSPLLHSFE